MTQGKVGLGLLGLFFGSSAYAQESPPVSEVPGLATDRPGLTDPSTLLEVGMLQVEVGFELASANAGGVVTRDVTLPQALVRVGVLPRLEVRFGADGYLASFANEEGAQIATTGFSDATLSLKIKVLESEALNFTIVPFLSIPTQDPNFSSGTFDPFVELVFDRDIPAGFNVGVNVNGASFTDEEGRFFEASGGLCLARGIVGDLGAYIEGFAVAPIGKGAPNIIVNGGFTQVLAENFQLDLAGGASVTNIGEFFVGFGVVARSLRWYQPASEPLSRK